MAYGLSWTELGSVKVSPTFIQSDPFHVEIKYDWWALYNLLNIPRDKVKQIEKFLDKCSFNLDIIDSDTGVRREYRFFTN